MDEFQRIDEIERVLGEQARGAHVLVGIGDDAAVLERPAGRCVLSVDTAVEGRHFRFELATPRQIGRRAAMAALSDLAAMGARPRALLLSLLIPERMDDASLLDLTAGVRAAAQEADAPVIGGNLSAADACSLTTTVIGEVQGAALLRSGAEPGQRLYCSGVVGAAALGLALVSSGLTGGGAEPFVARYVAPTAHLQQGMQLRGVASACIDISDGLLQDLGHLCRASRVGARVDFEALPLLPGTEVLAQRLGLATEQLALGGGDDYVLLFAVPRDTPLPFPAHPIGWTVEPELGIIVERSGQPLGLDNLVPGYQHFQK